MQKMPRRISLVGALVAVAMTAVLLGFCIVPVGRHLEWTRLKQQMDSSIRYMQPSQPNSISPDVWECAHNWVVTAYGNICIIEGTSKPEMYRLRDDLQKKLNGRIDLGTLNWIWNRLGESGQHGKRYTERFGPSFRECMQLQENTR